MLIPNCFSLSHSKIDKQNEANFHTQNDRQTNCTIKKRWLTVVQMLLSKLTSITLHFNRLLYVVVGVVNEYIQMASNIWSSQILFIITFLPTQYIYIYIYKFNENHILYPSTSDKRSQDVLECLTFYMGHLETPQSLSKCSSTKQMQKLAQDFWMVFDFNKLELFGNAWVRYNDFN